jgi:hypothetical protein
VAESQWLFNGYSTGVISNEKQTAILVALIGEGAPAHAPQDHGQLSVAESVATQKGQHKGHTKSLCPHRGGHPKQIPKRAKKQKKQG